MVFRATLMPVHGTARLAYSLGKLWKPSGRVEQYCVTAALVKIF